MKISMRTKVIVVIVILIIFCSILFTVRLNLQSDILLKEKQQLLTHANLDPVDRRIKVVQQQLELSVLHILHNKEIVEAFANQDREQLALLIDPLMVELKAIGIHIVHFHLPDATTFYRGHKPELYGDYLDFRNMVLEVIEDKDVISGFEFGISGLHYRYVTPIFVDSEFIGSFEVGVQFDEDILAIWQRASSGEWYIFSLDDENLGELLASTGEPFALTLSKNDLQKLAADKTIECKIDNYIVNMIPLKTYKGDIHWTIIRTFDNVEQLQMQKEQFTQNIIFGIALALSFGFISFIYLQKLFSPFNELIRVTDLWARGDLHNPLIVKTGDEIEKLADTMENMRVSLELQRKELRTNYQDLSVANGKLRELYELQDQEIATAAALHRSFLPAKLPTVTGISIAAFYVPAGRAGGDFYNAFTYREKLIVYLVDVSGHGLDGALLNVFIRNVIDQYIDLIEHKEKEFRPSEMVEYLVNKYVNEDFAEDYHFAIVAALYDPIEQVLTYVNAGNHILPFFCENERLHRLEGVGLPISSSIPPELMTYQDSTIEIACDDWVLLMSTDGIIEEEYNEERYGEERLSNLLLTHYNQNAAALLSTIAKDFREYTKKDTYTDDVTMIALSAGSQVSTTINLKSNTNI